MFAEKSDKLLQNFSFKTEIKTQSNKLKQGQKDIELGTTKWSFCYTETNKKLENSWFFVLIKSQHHLLTFWPIKLHRGFSKLFIYYSYISEANRTTPWNSLHFCWHLKRFCCSREILNWNKCYLFLIFLNSFITFLYIYFSSPWRSLR